MHVIFYIKTICFYLSRTHCFWDSLKHILHVCLFIKSEDTIFYWWYLGKALVQLAVYFPNPCWKSSFMRGQLVKGVLLLCMNWHAYPGWASNHLNGPACHTFSFTSSHLPLNFRYPEAAFCLKKGKQMVTSYYFLKWNSIIIPNEFV